MAHKSIRSNTNPLIERWSNVERVLEAMPEHDRLHHWSMAVWGEKTDCGSIHCAAGHCGLDTWFRRRGFKLHFEKGSTTAKISDVGAFFGFEGATRIFFNSAARPVETVIGEVRAYTDELRKLDELTADLMLPAIGGEWADQGGIYAGPRLGKNGAPDYLLIVGPEYDKYLAWRAANEWAGTLTVDDFHDFTLFDRSEGIALYDRVKSLFKPSGYWSSEQHAAGSNDAWAQGFTSGGQYGCGKGGLFRARAVRRVPIRSFDHSIISDGASAAVAA